MSLSSILMITFLLAPSHCPIFRSLPCRTQVKSLIAISLMWIFSNSCGARRLFANKVGIMKFSVLRRTWSLAVCGDVKQYSKTEDFLPILEEEARELCLKKKKHCEKSSSLCLCLEKGAEMADNIASIVFSFFLFLSFFYLHPAMSQTQTL